MSEVISKNVVMESLRPTPVSERTMKLPSTIFLWLGGNLVVTTILTGMYFVPDMSIGKALLAIIMGSLVGVVPLVFTGVIGTKTGLSTMAVSRASFGIKGSYLPSALNVISLLGWTIIQAGLAGTSLNYIMQSLTGYNNLRVCTIISALILIVVTIYGHKAIEKFANMACIIMVILILTLLYKLITTFGLAMITSYVIKPSAHNTTWFIAFDMCVATAISWGALTCDYNRNCPNVKTSIIGLSTGYFMSALLAMGLGIVTAAISVGIGNGISVDPTQCLAKFGFGLIAAIVIFGSLTITNVLGLYSTAMSAMNIFPKMNFKKSVIGLGTIVAIAALWSGLLSNFTTFIAFIGAINLPLFGIIIADFYIVQERSYDSDEILADSESSKYYYRKGLNPIAIGCYCVSAGASIYWSKINPPSFGSSVISLAFSFLLYIVVYKLLSKKDKNR